jgi:phosphatidylserine/phosphatidylglycerophosphate/cardiolipin synthase-like enzyme
MRKREKKDGITVNAIAGTHVAFFGLDLAPQFHKDFRGFAFKRKDHSTDEIVWLKAMKTFRETEPHPAISETFSTQDHPIQSFQWADYSVSPGTTYTYTIAAMYGDAKELELRRELNIKITTEVSEGETHTVFFNRGSVATQEYARRFMNKNPDQAGEGAYEWLSRGLVEALIKLIDTTKSGDAIHGAVYEFQYSKVLEALKRAHGRNVEVKIIFDDVESYDSKGKPDGPFQANREAIAAAKIKPLCHGRKNAKLMHNKFFVFGKKNKPAVVFSGSTNLTENGIFGHSNLGHIVEDKTVAGSYMDYWTRLYNDPEVDNDYRDANMEATPVPEAIEEGTTTIFSPRRTKLDSLNWYTEIAADVKDALFMTFAFGMHENFKEVYKRDDEILKMALMEKAYASPNVKERDEQDIQEIRNLPNVTVAIGNRIVTNSFDRWLEEKRSIDGRSKHVYWVHTKYMLADPLSANPVVISGSANFSKASTDTNDENMLVIKGDKRIADIYFGEYMRLYAHYAFREVLKWHLEAGGEKDDWKPQFLDNSDKWVKSYFTRNDASGRYKKREYFSGPMSV